MQVRIRKHTLHSDWWVVEKKYFYWPFWIYVSYHSKSKAIEIAQTLVDPEIEIISKKIS